MPAGGRAAIGGRPRARHVDAVPYRGVLTCIKFREPRPLYPLVP